jgi:hypothetical protein
MLAMDDVYDCTLQSLKTARYDLFQIHSVRNSIRLWAKNKKKKKGIQLHSMY